MKQKFLFFILLCSAMMFGQNSTFNNASGGGDGKWSTATNWTAGLPSITATISANVDLDTNVALTGGVTSGGNTVTTANNSKVTVTTSSATISTGLLCNGSSFNFNAPIEFNSGGNTTFLKSLQVNNVSGGSQRILTLGASSVLTLNSLMRVVTQFDSKVVFRGKIEGSSSLQLTGFSEFAATADNTNFNGDFVYITANSGTVTSNTTVDGGFLKAGRKVQINQTGNNLTINGANSCDGNVVVGGSHAFTLNINANQESFGTISVAEGSLAINVGASVTNLSFADCSLVTWGTAGTVAITGFQSGAIRFGISGGALTAAQLLKITADGTAAGKSLTLDANGYLVVDDLIVFNNASGAGDGKWSTATNWDSGSLPVVAAQLNANVNLDIDTTLSSPIH
jgi:hypothetical protein